MNKKATILLANPGGTEYVGQHRFPFRLQRAVAMFCSHGRTTRTHSAFAHDAAAFYISFIAFILDSRYESPRHDYRTHVITPIIDTRQYTRDDHATCFPLFLTAIDRFLLYKDVLGTCQRVYATLHCPTSCIWKLVEQRDGSGGSAR